MSKFNFIKTDIPDVQIIEPTVFGDDRGYFMETYQIDEFAAAGIDKPFVQDNQSRSTKGRAARPALPDQAHPGQARPRDPGRGVRCRRRLPPQQQDLRQVGGRNAVRRQQENALDSRGLRPRLCRAVPMWPSSATSAPTSTTHREGGIPYDDPTVNVQWPDCGCEHKTSAKDKEHTPFCRPEVRIF